MSFIDSLIFSIQLFFTTVLLAFNRKRTSVVKADLSGKVIVITGGNQGIGKEISTQLAKMAPAKLIIATRNYTRGEEAKNDLEVTAMRAVQAGLVLGDDRLDLAKFASIQTFAENIIKQNSRLDVLICNAGAGYSMPADENTQDKIDSCLQQNYLGHLYLVKLLLPLLRKTAEETGVPVRVIFTFSLHQAGGKLDLSNIGNRPVVRSTFEQYCNTQLYTILAAKGLAKQQENAGVLFFATYPGMAKTKYYTRISAPGKIAYTLPLAFFGSSAREGGITTTYLATQKRLEKDTKLNGSSWKNNEIFNDAELNPLYKDDASIQQLLDASFALLP